MHLADELLEHGFSDYEIGNNAVFQRSDRLNRVRGTAKHALGIGTDSQYALVLWPATDIDGHHRRLVEDDALTAHINQCVCGA